MSDSYSQLAADAPLRRAVAEACGLRAIEFFSATDSTQRRAREVAADDASDRALVVADFQTAGRGQHGRRWSAPAGSSVMFSLVVRPSSPEAMALIPIRAGLAAAEALDALLGNRDVVGLKWPNDLMARDGKLGGILCEGQVRSTDLRAVVGVGINVHPFLPEPGVTADPTFLDLLAARDVDRLEVLQTVVGAIRRALDEDAAELSPEEIRRYAERDWLAGHSIVEPLAGTVLGLNPAGHLVVQTDQGTVEEVIAGSVRIAGNQGRR